MKIKTLLLTVAGMLAVVVGIIAIQPFWPAPCSGPNLGPHCTEIQRQIRNEAIGAERKAETR